MVDVVVPVAIHQRTLDEAFAKENIHSYICAAFLTAHNMSLLCRCFAVRAISPGQFSQQHFAHISTALLWFALLVLRQRIIIR